ncbi:MAG TPA: hypothetical protein VFP46_01910 [Candidatus Paceibacterota bacterium]|nr:hypothetical protein [Candidatus Paceibacterota bacterium]
MPLAKRSSPLPHPLARVQTTFAHVANDDEFTVLTSAGTTLTLRKIDPIPASNLPGYIPRFVIPGQNIRPEAFNAMGLFGKYRWEYFYLLDDCPVTVRKSWPAGAICS